MSEQCPYSGDDPILLCKVSDLCDCFDYPEVNERAAEIIARRDAAFLARREEQS